MTYLQTTSLARAVHRARWLAELADALDQASRLTHRLRVAAEAGAEADAAAALAARIDALTRDVDSFRRSLPFARGEIAPNWIY